MSCKLEPAIWSRDTDQRIPCFGRCQLIITWMSNIKEVHGKPRLSTYYLEYGRHLTQLHCRCRCVYALTSNTRSHDNLEKIYSWVSFPFLYEYGAPLILAEITLNPTPLTLNQQLMQLKDPCFWSLKSTHL